MLAGSSGYIGKTVADELTILGYDIVCLVRGKTTRLNKNIKNYQVDVTNSKQMENFTKICPKINVIISCIGSKNGRLEDAWQVEYQANKNLLSLGAHYNIDHFILLSAICVQRPKLEFQYAKLAFENKLTNSNINFTIVRPTAFFKSLSGQIGNLKAGKKFIYFDEGDNTSCKPISQYDLARYICGCIGSKTRMNKTLSIGGPGPAITPRQMGLLLFKLLNKEPRFKSIPSKLFNYADTVLAPFSLFSKRLRNTREFIKIAHYYATESMLFFNYKSQIYEASFTPEFGNESLEDHYKKVINSKNLEDELGAHKLF